MFFTKYFMFSNFNRNLLMLLSLAKVTGTSNIFSYPLEFDYNAPSDIFEKNELKSNNNQRGFAIDLTQNQKWTNGIVPFVIDQQYSAREISLIHSAMRLIEDFTRKHGQDCIRFVPRTTETTYLKIFNGNGCWSYVGKRFTGAQLLSLKKPTIDSPASCLFIGTVAHELIHALGFDHEHVRPDRDNYVRIIWDKINNPQINANNFKIVQNGLDLGFEYDFDSIMHYHSTTFSVDGSPTIVPLKSGVELKNNFNRAYLSKTDVGEIRKFYGCEIENIRATTIRKTTRINPCDSKPCQNGGTCQMIGNGYSCACTFGCIGINCEQCTRTGRIQTQDFNRETCEHFRSLDLCDKNLFIGNLTIKQACPVTCGDPNCFDEFADSCYILFNLCNMFNQLKNNPCRKTCSAC